MSEIRSEIQEMRERLTEIVHDDVEHDLSAIEREYVREAEMFLDRVES